MTINYAAIADAAVAIIGSADAAQFQAAFDAMIAQTSSVQKVENRETELDVLSRMGIANGQTVLETIKQAGAAAFGSDVVTRLIESDRGVNLADAETIGFVNSLVAAGSLSSAQGDELLSTNTVTSPVWPGLRPGYVQNALERRAAGAI